MELFAKEMQLYPKRSHQLLNEGMNDVEKTVLASNFTHVNHEKTLKAKEKEVVTTQNLLPFWIAKASTKSLSNARVKSIYAFGRVFKLGLVNYSHYMSGHIKRLKNKHAFNSIKVDF